MKNIGFVLLMLVLFSSSSFATEGMWTLDNLPKAHLKSSYNFEPNQKWIDHAQRSAVRLAGGCSGSFISPDGLVMTNHHCARGCIDQLSNAKDNYIEKGFLAENKAAEKKCPAFEVNRLDAIIDVTANVQTATAGLDGEAFSKKQKAVSSKMEADCVGKDSANTRCDLVKLYQGGRYALYKYRRYQDVRLVWAPEVSIAFFGGDPDNFNFPRYNLDGSFLRVYDNGKPLKVKDYFPFSSNGAAENELVMTLGHPGTTQRLLTVSQLERVRDIDMIPRLWYASELRGVLTQFGADNEERRRIAQDDLFGIENSIKARKGMTQTLLDNKFMAMKRLQEAELREFVDADADRKAKYGQAWDEIAKAQEKYKHLAIPHSFFEGGRALSSTHFYNARTLVRAAAERQKPNTERLREYTESALPFLQANLFSEAPIYSDLEKLTIAFGLSKTREWMGVDHPQVKALLGKESPEAMAARLVDQTKLADIAVRKALWDGGQKAIDASTDPFIVVAKAIDAYSREIRERMENEVEAIETKNAERIAQVRFEKFGTSVYPDATFSLRLSDGVVRGWQNGEDNVPAFSIIDNTFDRATGSFPFALPQSWIDNRNNLNPKQAFNFVSTNDIIGGNSGSPIINRNAEVVGLVFDGNIHSLGGAYWFDEKLNRTVSVHSGAILESLKKVYRAQNLVNEIESAMKRK